MNRFHRWYCRTGHWRHEIQDEILPWVLHDLDLGDDILEVGPGPASPPTSSLAACRR